MKDKQFCASCFLAFRYIWSDDVDFYEGINHQILKLKKDSEKVLVKTADDIDAEIRKIIQEVYAKYQKVGILLSGGMDSSIVASYLRPESHAYTFVTDNSSIFNQDIDRAKKCCEKHGLILHFVKITFDDFRNLTPRLMKRKGAPVHSIEPQILKAAEQAKQDGVQIMVIGDGADYVFGGMDKLLAKDWNYEEFVNRYIYLNPREILINPNMDAVDLFFRPFAQLNGKIDFLGVMNGPNTEESYNSYWNAFETAQIPYIDPYEDMKMAYPLDLERVRKGDSKYLIRELYKQRYPDFEIPEKIPMPRPVNEFLADWEGPRRPEFRKDIDITKYSGNQKWLIWCLEQFFNMYE